MKSVFRIATTLAAAIALVAAPALADGKGKGKGKHRHDHDDVVEVIRVVHYRPGHAKTGALHVVEVLLHIFQELQRDGFQAVIIGAGKRGLRQRVANALFRRKNGQTGLGAADVPGE